MRKTKCPNTFDLGLDLGLESDSSLDKFKAIPIPNEPIDDIINYVEINGLFLYNGYLHMRVHPAKWMMNSTLIYEHITQRDSILAVNLETGKADFLSAKTKVQMVAPIKATYNLAEK